MKQGKMCIYCNNRVADTIDHIPPKSIFSKPLPSNLITVPCCKQCNDGFALDDEYFMVILALIEDTSKNTYKYKLFEKLQRMKLREESRSLLQYIEKSFEAKIKISKEGLILLNQPGLNVDQKRIRNTVNRIINGLVYKETGFTAIEVISIFTTDYNRLTSEMSKQLIDVIELLRYGDLVKIGDGKIFGYKVAYPKSCPEVSGWILSFFETYYVVALARHSNYSGKFHLPTD
jgi:hypothetical protein